MADQVLLNHLLDDYAQATGIGQLVPDASGVVALSFNGSLVLHIAPGSEADQAVLYARLSAPLYDDHAPELMRQMLEANLLGDETGGGTLAIDARDGAPMLLHRVMLQGLSSVAFREMVSGLAAAGQNWSDFLSAEHAPGLAQPDALPAPHPNFVRV